MFINALTNNKYSLINIRTRTCFSCYDIKMPVDPKLQPVMGMRMSVDSLFIWLRVVYRDGRCGAERQHEKIPLIIYEHVVAS